MKHLNNSLLILTCLLITACSGTRHLPTGEKLYVGATLVVESEDAINKGLIKRATKDALRPQPNTSYVGMRPKLVLYQAAGKNPSSKFRLWLKKMGEAPVLMSSIKPEATATLIDAKLFNLGFFTSNTTSDITEKRHTANVVYTSRVSTPFRMKELTYAISDDSISNLILANTNQSLLNVGDAYNLDQLKNERLRIDALLKNNGYFNFSPEYLLFKADTSNMDHGILFTLTLKDSIPSNAFTKYRINHVVVNQNYSLNDPGLLTATDSISYENRVILGNESQQYLMPRIISQSIYFRKGDVFSHVNHTNTLKRFMSMGMFKLVQLNYAVNKDSIPGLLDVTILLTPLSKYSFSAEMNAVTKSNNYTGPRMNLSLLNRNTFKGGELLNFNLAGTYEAQLSGKDKGLYSYSYSPQLELTFPRFLMPFDFPTSNRFYNPKTSALLSYNYLKKVNYFDMHTFKLVLGYRWMETIRQAYELNPIDVSFSSIRNKSTTFSALLESNPFLKKSYEEQFIAGSSLSFTYSDQMIPDKKVQSFVQVKTELAGNVLSLANTLAGRSISSDHPAKVAGSIYSQFAKISLEGRVFYTLSSGNKVALRVFTGVGKPYGNSAVLPYTRQFFSGGPNSLRAFQLNSVGPGNYFQDTHLQGFLQTGGDVKLEMNAEYRFNIFSYFKGALFVDAGNVWLLTSNPTTAGIPFAISGFTDQVAVGAGLGLRVDLSFFILRFDLAMPLRKPWFEGNNHWVTHQIDVGSSVWRKDNLVLNVAIGYPF
jgi:outer membrane protein assembly factor BamA